MRTGQEKKSCSWATKANRCNRKEKKGIHKGKRVYEICPVACKCLASTCAYCGPKCEDDPNFMYRGDPAMTCDWVKERKKRRKRCNKEGVREACPVTCQATREGDRCEDGGVHVELCTKRMKWETLGCVKEGAMGVAVGWHPAKVASDEGSYGYSYYRRAFDLIQDTPVQELGYGQWTSGTKENLEVCGRHPHSFVCGEIPPTENQMENELEFCASQDLETLEQCTYGCCGEPHKCWLSGGSNIEGGMGYWMYTLENPHVKWMGPGK